MAKPQRATRAALTGPGNRPRLDTMGEFFGVGKDFPNIVELSLDELDPNPDQPRTVFHDDDLRALAASLERHGQQQPILVREGQAGRYLIVFGERRVRASRLLGRTTIYAIVTKSSSPEIALIENVQRTDLDAVDLAQSLDRLSKSGYTQDEIGLLIGKDRTRVAKILSILNLPREMLEDYQQRHRGTVSQSALIELAQIDDQEARRDLWQQVTQGLGLVELRRLRQHARQQTPEKVPPSSEPRKHIERAVQRIDTEVKRLTRQRPHLTNEDERKLRELRDAIDLLLAEKT